METKTPISALQEFLINQKKIPTYELIKNGVGTHNPEFIYRVKVHDLYEDGIGKSKQEAKHRAAAKMLSTLNSNTSVPIPEQLLESEINLGENYVGQLKEYCLTNSYASPTYDVEEEAGPSHSKVFKMACSVSLMKEYGVAKTKKAAKQRSAYKMLQHIRTLRKDKTGTEVDCDTPDGDLQIKRSPVKIPAMSISVEEVIKKQTNLKTNYAVPKKDRIVYYKDHQRAYIGLEKSSSTLALVLENKISPTEDNSLDLVHKIVTELGGTLTCVRGKSQNGMDIMFLEVSGDGDWPPFSSFGCNERATALSVLQSLTILCSL